MSPKLREHRRRLVEFARKKGLNTFESLYSAGFSFDDTNACIRDGRLVVTREGLKRGEPSWVVVRGTSVPNCTEPEILPSDVRTAMHLFASVGTLFPHASSEYGKSCYLPSIGALDIGLYVHGYSGLKEQERPITEIWNDDDETLVELCKPLSAIGTMTLIPGSVRLRVTCQRHLVVTDVLKSFRPQFDAYHMKWRRRSNARVVEMLAHRIIPAVDE